MISRLCAAETVGVRTWRAITGAYLWAGLFTAPAGIMLAIRYDAASMNYGVGYEYDAIAAVLVGGTVIKGGEGSAVRTLAGAIVIGIVQVVLVLQGLRSEWQYLIAGLIVLADISNPLMAEIVLGAEAVLRSAGYSLLLMNSENDPALDAQHIRFFQSRRVDGMLLSLASETAAPPVRPSAAENWLDASWNCSRLSVVKLMSGPL